MYAGHLQHLFKDLEVTIVNDNAVSHAKTRKNEKNRMLVHRRSASDPGEIILLSAAGYGPKKRCRWQSTPARNTSDMAPILKRSVGGPTVSLTSLHAAYSKPVFNKDVPPKFKRSTDKLLPLIHILDSIDTLRIDHLSDDYTDKDSFLGTSSSHTV